MTKQKNFTATLTLFAMLVCLDLCFFLIHALHAWTPWFDAHHFSLEADRGLAEFYQYIKEFWIVLCMAAAFLLTRIRAFIGWSILFAFLLLDDAAEIHERVGFLLGARFDLPAWGGLRPDDFGEILFAAFIGSLTLGMVIYTLLRGTPDARTSARDILLLVGALAFFGVAVDAVHVVSYFKAPAIAPLLALIEDGGEMIIISALTCYAFDIVSNNGWIRFDIWKSGKSLWRDRTAARPAQ